MKLIPIPALPWHRQEPSRVLGRSTCKGSGGDHDPRASVGCRTFASHMCCLWTSSCPKLSVCSMQSVRYLPSSNTEKGFSTTVVATTTTTVSVEELSPPKGRRAKGTHSTRAHTGLTRSLQFSALMAVWPRREESEAASGRRRGGAEPAGESIQQEGQAKEQEGRCPGQERQEEGAATEKVNASVLLPKGVRRTVIPASGCAWRRTPICALRAPCGTRAPSPPLRLLLTHTSEGALKGAELVAETVPNSTRWPASRNTSSASRE